MAAGAVQGLVQSKIFCVHLCFLCCGNHQSTSGL